MFERNYSPFPSLSVVLSLRDIPKTKFWVKQNGLIQAAIRGTALLAPIAAALIWGYHLAGYLLNGPSKINKLNGLSYRALVFLKSVNICVGGSKGLLLSTLLSNSLLCFNWVWAIFWQIRHPSNVHFSSFQLNACMHIFSSASSSNRKLMENTPSRSKKAVQHAELRCNKNEGSLFFFCTVWQCFTRMS